MQVLRRFAGALLSAALIAVPAGVAQADAPWSAPATIGSTAAAVTDPTIAFDTQGRALVSARFTATATSIARSRLFVRDPAGAPFAPFGEPMSLDAPPITYGTRSAAFLRRSAGAGTGLTKILGTSFGTTTTKSAGGFRELTSRAEPGL